MICVACEGPLEMNVFRSLEISLTTFCRKCDKRLSGRFYAPLGSMKREEEQGSDHFRPLSRRKIRLYFPPDLDSNNAIRQQDVSKTPFNFAQPIRPWKLKSSALAGPVTNSTSNPSTITCLVRSVVQPAARMAPPRAMRSSNNQLTPG